MRRGLIVSLAVMPPIRATWAWRLAAALAVGAVALAAASEARGAPAFVTTSGTHLVLDGSNFYYGGINADYLAAESTASAQQDLATAEANRFSVVRTFGFNDTGNPATTTGTGTPNGFQYWNGTGPAYNDGASGLGALDWVIYQAEQDGLHLVIPLVNNWSSYGGMDQYVCWKYCTTANSVNCSTCFIGNHDDFYTDSTIVGWFKAWINHLLNHVNMYSGIAYKNDPTILAWSSRTSRDVTAQIQRLTQGLVGARLIARLCLGSRVWLRT